MTSLESQWMLSPSGSRAMHGSWPMEDQERQYQTYTLQDASFQDVLMSAQDTGDDDENTALNTANTFATGELPHGAVMSTTVPPNWNGRGSWFAFEELVYDWENGCTLDKALRGPAFKNRLHDEAQVFKPMLNRDLLKDENGGVEYFLNAL